MCTPFCAGSRSTEAVDVGKRSAFRPPPQRRRIALATPCTPARDMAEPHFGRRKPAGRPGALVTPSWTKGFNVRPPRGGIQTPVFPRLVSLAAPRPCAHPLATIHGFAQTLVRMKRPRRAETALPRDDRRRCALQLAELLDELGVRRAPSRATATSRIASPSTLSTSRATRPRSWERNVSSSSGTRRGRAGSTSTRPQRGVAALAQGGSAARRGLEQVDLRVDGG